MIVWVHQMCRTWGRQVRGLEAVPVRPSLWDRITTGWSIAAAAAGGHRPWYAEALTGDALKISIAIKHAIAAGDLKERRYTLLYLHYVATGLVKQKIAFSELPDRNYYYDLHRAHLALTSYLPDQTPNLQEMLQKKLAT